VLISATEPAALRAIGQVNEYAEQHGCDIFFVARGKKIGIQRKEIKDLFGSIEYGRLQNQMDKMTNLDDAYLIVEGEPRFSTDGKVMGKRYGQPWNRDRYVGVLIGVQHRGLHVLHTKDLAGTIHLVQYLEKWHLKEEHSMLRGAARQGPTTLFGSSPTQREFAVHFLTGIPGVGSKMAGAIFDMYGLPLQLTVTVDDLVKVPGIGKAKAARIMRAFQERKASEFVT
jgi:ERCC4-type nuclease